MRPQRHLRARDAIVLTLVALPAVDRYGAVTDGQQYAGFFAIEAAPHALGEATEHDRAVTRLADVIRSSTSSTDVAEMARVARQLSHDQPDRVPRRSHARPSRL